MPTHIIPSLAAPRTELDREWEAIRSDLFRLGDRVDTAIDWAIAALINHDKRLARAVLAGDQIINAHRYQLEDTCLTAVVRHRPVARDLHRLIAMVHVAGELERMGDLARRFRDNTGSHLFAVGVAQSGTHRRPLCECERAHPAALTLWIGSVTMSMGMNKDKYRVLVLCTGNSARSQMAEGLINTQLADRFVAYSAGTQPAGYVHPQAIAALREIGIDIADHRSKLADEFKDTPFDVVITVCDDAAENCPVWLGQGQRVHIGFPDPAAAGPAEQAQHFRVVRDAIQDRLLSYLRSWQPDATRRNHDHQFNSQRFRS